MRSTHTITNLDSLQRTLWLRRGTRIALALPSFSIVQQENLELRLNRQLADSGSEYCIFAFIAVLIGSILFDAARWADFTAHDARMIAANLFICLAAAVFGKTVGYLHSRWQLARLIWAVAERLEAIEDNATPLPFPSAPHAGLIAMHSSRVPASTRAAIL